MAKAVRSQNTEFNVTLQLDDAEFRVLRDLLGGTSPNERTGHLLSIDAKHEGGADRQFRRYATRDGVQNIYKELCKVEDPDG
jgi:hypothetical protein